jgi:hypothetical protein
MGLSAYLATGVEREHYMREEQREREEVLTRPDDEREEIFEIMAEYGVSRGAARPLVNSLENNHDMWVKVSLLAAIRLSSKTQREVFLS